MSRRRQAFAASGVQIAYSRRYREAKVMATADGIFRRVDAFEYAWCLRLNRGCQRRRAVRDVFSAVSKLGDGIFWYGLILLLPAFFGAEAILPAVRMAIVGLVGVLLYKY